MTDAKPQEDWQTLIPNIDPHAFERDYRFHLLDDKVVFTKVADKSDPSAHGDGVIDGRPILQGEDDLVARGTFLHAWLGNSSGYPELSDAQVKSLLEAAFKTCDHKGNTAFNKFICDPMVSKKHKEIMLNMGTPEELYIRNKRGGTAFVSLIHHPLEYPVHVDGNPPESPSIALFRKAAETQPELLFKADKNGNTPLHHAILNRKTGAANNLIDVATQDQLLTKNDQNKTALHLLLDRVEEYQAESSLRDAPRSRNMDLVKLICDKTSATELKPYADQYAVLQHFLERQKIEEKYGNQGISGKAR